MRTSPIAKPRASKSRRKTARQKLESVYPSHGVPFQVTLKSADGAKPSTMVVPRPLDVEAAMRTPRKGKLLTIGQIRASLAGKSSADVCCPLTTGIFVRLVGDAAEEDAAAGKKRFTPYWRTVRDDGSLIDKFPGGTAAQAAKLKKEGWKVVPGKGKKPPRIADFAKKLVTLS